MVLNANYSFSGKLAQIMDIFTIFAYREAILYVVISLHPAC